MLDIVTKKSSFRSIEKSILYDYQTYRWFLFFVLQPSVQKEFFDDTVFQRLLRKLKATLMLQAALVVFAVAFLSVFAWLEFKTNFILSAAIFVVALFLVFKKKKQYAAEMGIIVLKKDFDDKAIASKTLYQVCENYGQRYNISSLVDGIFAVDSRMRKIIKALLVLEVLIFSFKVVASILILIPVFFFSLFLLSSSFFYKFYKD